MASAHFTVYTTSLLKEFTLTDAKDKQYLFDRSGLDHYLTKTYGSDFSAYVFKSLGQSFTPEHAVSHSFQVQFVKKILTLERQKKETS